MTALRTDTTPADIANRSDRRHADDVEAHGDADRRDIADAAALAEATHPTPCAELERRWRWGLKTAATAAVIVGAGWGALWYQVGRAIERDADRREAIAEIRATIAVSDARQEELLRGQRTILAALGHALPLTIP